MSHFCDDSFQSDCGRLLQHNRQNAGRRLIQLSVASWAVFPTNWAGFDTKLRENFGVCGLRFLGLLFV